MSLRFLTLIALSIIVTCFAGCKNDDSEDAQPTTQSNTGGGNTGGGNTGGGNTGGGNTGGGNTGGGNTGGGNTGGGTQTQNGTLRVYSNHRILDTYDLMLTVTKSGFEDWKYLNNRYTSGDIASCSNTANGTSVEDFSLAPGNYTLRIEQGSNGINYTEPITITSGGCLIKKISSLNTSMGIFKVYKATNSYRAISIYQNGIIGYEQLLTVKFSENNPPAEFQQGAFTRYLPAGSYSLFIMTSQNDIGSGPYGFTVYPNGEVTTRIIY